MEWIRIFPSQAAALEVLKENTPRLLILDGRRIALVLRSGNFYAVEDSCPHNGESLSKGALNFAGELVCPLHGYQFGLNSGREAFERCRDLKTYRVLVNENGFFVGV